MGGPSGSWEFAYEEDVRMSRVPWNFGDGPTVSGDVHEVILHEGSTVWVASRSSAARSADRCR
jgi:hypothetical protein